jgi:hypothetical protein
MLGQIRSFANQLGHLSFLLRGESRFGSGSGSIVKALQTFRIVAVHPVAKNLQVPAMAIGPGHLRAAPARGLG